MAVTLTAEQIAALDKMNEASRRAGGVGTILNKLATADAGGGEEESLAETVATLQQTVTQLQSQLGTLQSTVDGMSGYDARITAAQSKADEADEAVTTLQGTVDGMSDYGTRLTAVESKASTNEGNITTLQGNYNTLEGRVAKLESPPAG